MGIRYGRIPDGADAVEWSFVSHCDCDGIGGFARLLRERGLEIGALPQTNHPCRGVIGPLWRLWRASREARKCAVRGDWKRPEAFRAGLSESVAWHLFSEAETLSIRERCRRDGVTVNSCLLKHLDAAVRPEVSKADARIPWMVPVNLRGDFNHADDTENHVSSVEVQIEMSDTAATIQRQIRQRLERGEHRANHLLLGLGRFMNPQTKVALLRKDRSKPAGNIGAFSNLGAWDAEKKLATRDAWLFCPPVVQGQLLGAGCVTFQNRLGVTIQGHVSAPLDLARNWMQRWVGGLGK